MINGIVVQNNPLKYIDPRGLTADRFKNNNISNQQTSSPVPGGGISRSVNPRAYHANAISEARRANHSNSASGVVDYVKKAANAVASVVNQAVVKATAFHFEKRYAKNEPFNNLTHNDVEHNEEWLKLEKWQVGTHSDGKGKMEMKFVHKMTGAELVFNGDANNGVHEKMTQVGLAGTPNYVNPMRNRDLRIGNALEYARRFVGHALFDVVPFWIGGDIRGSNEDHGISSHFR